MWIQNGGVRMTENKRFTELMKIEHEQWCYWSKGISNDLKKLINLIDLESLSGDDHDFVVGQLDRLDRWSYLWNMDYEKYNGNKEVERLYAQKVCNLMNELLEENEQLKKEKEDWKSKCLNASSENSILWNEINILREQGAKPSKAFEKYLDSISSEYDKFWEREIIYRLTYLESLLVELKDVNVELERDWWKE